MMEEKDTFESDYYWYTKRIIPEEARNKIRQMAVGKVVDEIEFSGMQEKTHGSERGYSLHYLLKTGSTL